MKKIEIITLDITLVGGVERVISNLANRFSKNDDYDVVIISIFNTNKELFYKIDSKVQVQFLTDKSFEMKNFTSRVKSYYILVIQLLRYLSQSGADTLISMFTNINILLALFRSDGKQKIIATEHSQYTAHGKIVRTLRKLFYRRLDNIVVLNSTDYEKFYQFLGNKVKLIPNPLTFESYIYSNLESKILLSAGRLNEVKGFDLLIHAYAEVNRLFPEWKLIIVGEGEERDNLIKLVSDLKLSHSIEIRHFEKNIDKLFLESSIYCLSSKQECFPMVLLEAMSFGLPVISFDVPSGPKDIIRNGEDGFLVEAFDIEEYSKKIIYLIQNIDARIKMGENARNNIMRYSIDRIYKLWEEILE